MKLNKTQKTMMELITRRKLVLYKEKQAQCDLISAYMYVLSDERIAYEENEANCNIGVILYWYTLNKNGEREYIAQTSAFYRDDDSRYSDYSFSNKVEGR